LPQFTTVSLVAALFQYVGQSQSVHVALQRVHRTLSVCSFDSFLCFPIGARTGRNIDLAVFVMSTSAEIWPSSYTALSEAALWDFAGAQVAEQGVRLHLQQRPASALWQQRSLLVRLWQIQR